MNVRLHPHALDRMAERGATDREVISTIESGERLAAKFGRTGFRRNFDFRGRWLGREYAAKQIEAIAVEDENGGGWLVITVVVKYYG
jgi:hypothetical protein